MTFYFYILLLLRGLTGTCSVTTVTQVSVKTGQSLSIPCHYEPKYIKNVKYLCKGYNWASCSFAIKSTETKKSTKFSISDDKVQSIVTMTIKKLEIRDTDFWCGVEINRGSDDGQYFQLSFKTGLPFLSVKSQDITGFRGKDVSIQFEEVPSDNIRFCRFNGACVASHSGVINGAEVIIKKTHLKVFTVTFSGLQLQSSGWYMCEAGGYQMPVHVTVNESPTTAVMTRDPGVTSLENKKHSTSFDVNSLIISLSVLMAIVIVALIIWLLLRRKQTKADTSATTKQSHSDSVAPQTEDEVTYSSVVLVKHNQTQRSHNEQKTDVLYSTVVTKREQNAIISSPARSDDDVEYSSIIAVKHPAKKTQGGVGEIIYSTVAEGS